MRFKIDLESEPGIAVTIANGSMTLDDIKECTSALLRATDGTASRKLWDLREASFDLDAEQVKELAGFIKELKLGPTSRSALVVAGDLEFGLVRMYEAFRESSESQTKVFRDGDLAVEWLNQP